MEEYCYSLAIPTKLITMASLLLVTISLLSPAVTITAQASSSTPTTPPTIQRTTKQQILASIPPHSTDSYSSQQPFLTSPSGKYTGYLLRRETAPGAGGYGNDFCYVQIQDTSSGDSMWESDCAPVSSVNTCALVFDGAGLELFDGSTSEWDTSAQSASGNPLETVELVDEGDLRIRDDQGELAWRASDEPRANQQCGSPGSPGLAPAMPPFAVPIGSGRNLPFGQQSSSSQQLGPQPNAMHNSHPLPVMNGVSQSFGFDSQPLVDNTPYASGCTRGTTVLLATTTLVALLLASTFLFY